jgi:hypothetical protein
MTPACKAYSPLGEFISNFRKFEAKFRAEFEGKEAKGGAGLGKGDLDKFAEACRTLAGELAHPSEWTVSSSPSHFATCSFSNSICSSHNRRVSKLQLIPAQPTPFRWSQSPRGWRRSFSANNTRKFRRRWPETARGRAERSQTRRNASAFSARLSNPSFFFLFFSSRDHVWSFGYFVFTVSRHLFCRLRWWPTRASTATACSCGAQRQLHVRSSSCLTWGFWSPKPLNISALTSGLVRKSNPNPNLNPNPNTQLQLSPQN